MRRRIAAILAGSLALLPTAASAEEEASSFDDLLAEPRVYTIDEIASDLAYGFCPLFLAEQFELDGPELAERGFSSTVEMAPHPQFGEVSMATLEREDGRVAFGGVAGRICMVVFGGPHGAAALDALRERMGWTGLDFQTASRPSPALATGTIESFEAPVDGQMLYLQLIHYDAPPLVVALLFAEAG